MCFFSICENFFLKKISNPSIVNIGIGIVPNNNNCEKSL